MLVYKVLQELLNLTGNCNAFMMANKLREPFCQLGDENSKVFDYSINFETAMYPKNLNNYHCTESLEMMMICTNV